MLFKLSNLSSNLALTLGYLNPAFNNSAQVDNVSSFWLWIREFPFFHFFHFNFKSHFRPKSSRSAYLSFKSGRLSRIAEVNNSQADMKNFGGSLFNLCACLHFTVYMFRRHSEKWSLRQLCRLWVLLLMRFAIVQFTWSWIWTYPDSVLPR